MTVRPIDFRAVKKLTSRFVDFIKESISEYSDSQVRAAVQDIHRDCAAVIERLFEIRPAIGQSEGEEVEVPAGYDPAEFRLTGNVTGQPPHRGVLCHHGWKAEKCEMPEWTGSDHAARMIAAAEVELS